MAPALAKALIYGSLLIMSIAASVWVTVRDETPPGKPNISSFNERSSKRGVATLPVVSTNDDLIVPIRQFPDSDVVDGYHDPFSTPSRASAPVPEPPPIPAPAVPQRPTVPDMPFKYRGRLTDSSGAWIVQLSRGKDFFAVGPGDTIEATYRVDTIESDRLRIVYLPTSTVQEMPMSLEQESR